jgi:hypothetical protein
MRLFVNAQLVVQRKHLVVACLYVGLHFIDTALPKLPKCGPL